MKKLLLGIICLLAFSFCTVKAAELPEKTDHEIVTIYIFRGSGCSHCYEALEYFSNFFAVNPEYKDYIQVKAYEVWYDSNNQALLQAVLKHFDDSSNGVPYIVVGNAYHNAGFITTLGEEIIQTALDEYENKDYKDVVLEETNNVDQTTNVATLEEAATAEGIITSEYSASKDENHSSDGWIIAGIFAVVIGGMVALVVLSKKKD